LGTAHICFATHSTNIQELSSTWRKHVFVIINPQQLLSCQVYSLGIRVGGMLASLHA